MSSVSYTLFQYVCDADSTEQISVQEAIFLADENPCFSMISLITLLQVRGNYPPPFDIDEQEELVYEISDQVVTVWDQVISEELESIRSDCMQADIDFEFVIDSSGSVGYSRWELTMQLIGENWIKEVIVPNGAKQCGNHVAGRWFSTDSERFFDFEPPEESVYASQSYAEYVGDKFINQSYISGLTNTGLALEQTRIVDLPMARDGPKYVMVFTDGVSNNFTATSIEAQKLHGVADRTYAFGIGKSYREVELEAIATDPAYVGTMKNFDDLEAYVQ